jgi:hypothetical protein
MSRRTRSVEWIEGRIMAVLSNVRQGKYPTSLVLSAMSLKFEMRSHIEQDNFDYALFNLIRAGSIIPFQDENGFKCFKLAA